MSFEIRYRDTDPDTGRISQDKKIATCDSLQSARWVLAALLKYDEIEDPDPNREIYTIPEISK